MADSDEPDEDLPDWLPARSQSGVDPKFVDGEYVVPEQGDGQIQFGDVPNGARIRIAGGRATVRAESIGDGASVVFERSVRSVDLQHGFSSAEVVAIHGQPMRVALDGAAPTPTTLRVGGQGQLHVDVRHEAVWNLEAVAAPHLVVGVTGDSPSLVACQGGRTDPHLPQLAPTQIQLLDDADLNVNRGTSRPQWLSGEARPVDISGDGSVAWHGDLVKGSRVKLSGDLYASSARGVAIENVRDCRLIGTVSSQLTVETAATHKAAGVMADTRTLATGAVDVERIEGGRLTATEVTATQAQSVERLEATTITLNGADATALIGRPEGSIHLEGKVDGLTLDGCGADLELDQVTVGSLQASRLGVVRAKGAVLAADPEETDGHGAKISVEAVSLEFDSTTKVSGADLHASSIELDGPVERSACVAGKRLAIKQDRGRNELESHGNLSIEGSVENATTAGGQSEVDWAPDPEAGGCIAAISDTKAWIRLSGSPDDRLELKNLIVSGLSLASSSPPRLALVESGQVPVELDTSEAVTLTIDECSGEPELVLPDLAASPSVEIVGRDLQDARLKISREGTHDLTVDLGAGTVVRVAQSHGKLTLRSGATELMHDFDGTVVSMEGDKDTHTPGLWADGVVAQLEGPVRLQLGPRARVTGVTPRKLRSSVTPARIKSLQLVSRDDERRSGTIRRCDVASLPPDEMEAASERLEVLEPDPASMIAWARNLAQDPTPGLPAEAEKAGLLARTLRERAVSGSSSSATRWAASRLHHETLDRWGAEYWLRWAHRAVGYGVRPLPALLCWTVVSVLVAAFFAGDVESCDAVQLAGVEVTALQSCSSEPADGFLLRFFDTLAAPAKLLQIQADVRPLEFIEGARLRTVASILIGFPFAFFLVALRNYLRSGTG